MKRLFVATIVLLFSLPLYASTDPVKDTRQIMAGTVTTAKVKNEYLSGARDSTTSFKGALSAYKAVRAAEIVTPTPTPPTPTPVPASSGTVVYDMSIGTGVDANGFAILPLHSGAHRYFISSAIGADANGCVAAQQPTRPLATINAARSCLAPGLGDQMLIAEGTSYAEGLTNLMDQMGYSAAYPTVVESYDPADALNESKYGHAANGRRPVVNTGGNNQLITCYCGNTPSAPNNFLAIRGLDFNPGDKPGMDIGFIGPTNFILIENNLFRYTSLTFDNAGPTIPRSSHHVIRMNSLYGEWHPSAHAQGIFDSGTDSLIVEDNVLWHNGWRLGVSRDEPILTGGPTMFRHPLYAQNYDTGILYRRNLVIDAAADGGHLLGSSVATENVIIDCPIALDMTGGVGADVRQPNGVFFEASYNAIVGSSDLNSANPRGYGVTTSNGTLGSSVHHNLLIRANNLAASGRVTYSIGAGVLPAYMDFHDNVSFLRSQPGKTHFEYPDTSVTPATPVYATYNNNIWDNAAEGTNRDVAAVIFPHPYTAGELYVALGFSDRQAFIGFAVEHPEAFVGRKARALLFAGYGMQ